MPAKARIQHWGFDIICQLRGLERSNREGFSCFIVVKRGLVVPVAILLAFPVLVGRGLFRGIPDQARLETAWHEDPF